MFQSQFNCFVVITKASFASVEHNTLSACFINIILKMSSVLDFQFENENT